jgi:hypothetical protein
VVSYLGAKVRIAAPIANNHTPLGPGSIPTIHLTEDEVVWPEDLAVRAGADGVHGSRLQVHENGAGHIASCCQSLV